MQENAEKMEDFAKRQEEAIENGSEDFTFRPGDQDVKLLSKVDPKCVEQVCRKVLLADPDIPKYSYLEDVVVLPKKLPVRGAIFGENMMWINLACQAQELKLQDGKLERGPVKYITFFVAPDVPFTYLSKEAMESLTSDLKSWSPEKQEIQFYPPQLGIETAYVSPASSSFCGANILGSNVLKRSKVDLYVDYGKNYFKMFETARDENKGT